MKTNNASLSKRCLCLILSFCCMVACAVTPAFATEGNQEPERIGGSGTGYIEKRMGEDLVESQMFLSWHPDFDAPVFDAAFYYFQTKKDTVDVSLGGSYAGVSVSITIALGDTGVSGYSIRVPASRVWSRPAIYGDLYKVTYWYGLYDFNRNMWINHQERVRYETKNSWIIIECNSDRQKLV